MCPWESGNGSLAGRVLPRREKSGELISNEQKEGGHAASDRRRFMSLSFFAVAEAQLPPEILVERYLLRAGRLMESKDPKGALEVMSKIVSLQKCAALGTLLNYWNNL